jgi:hypothetical protein
VVLKDSTKRRVIKMKKPAILAGTAFFLLSFLGINCHAEGEVIYGCYQKHGGELRIVANNHSCRHNEISVSWNKTGPQGPAGPTGPMGAAGPAGTQPLAASQAQNPRVYDFNNNLVGVFPSTWEGLLSFFVPTLSTFLFISPGSGDVDPSYPSFSVYYDSVGCTGNSFLDVEVRYQVVKVGSKYLTGQDGRALCTNDPSTKIGYVSTPQWGGDGSFSRSCTDVVPDPNLCTLVAPAKEITFPFPMPVALPVHFE